VRRREFLRNGLTAVGAAALGRRVAAQPPALDDDGWRTFEATTRVEVMRPAGKTRVWLPTPLAETPYQRTLGDTYHAEGGFVEMLERPGDLLDMLIAEWPDGVAPVLTLTSRIATRDRVVDLATPGVAPGDLSTDISQFSAFLHPTKLIPTDGIVRKTADQITRGAATDLERARAIYDWIVENTFRDPATPGCGRGDIRFMLETGNLGGKCADINALFVGLARASGIPARGVYGLRVAPSRLGARSLGLASNAATRAQHCRAEAYLVGFGWVPVDPADVRKFVLEEPPGKLPLGGEKARAVRERLFGSWEMNWIAYNYAHDVVLPGARRGSLPYFMYPQAETAKERIDSLDPDAFRYEITARKA
jgi:transglutaminase-like putative cysteine protease